MKRTECVLRWKALRAFSFPLSALPVLVAFAAGGSPSTWNGSVLALSLWGVVCLHGFGNLVNDYWDHAYGVDSRLEEDEGRPGRLLVQARLLPRDYAVLALLCLLGLFPAVVALLRIRGTEILPYGLGALLLAWAYTGPPFRMKHRGLGALVIFLVFGPLLVCGAADPPTLPILLLSLLVGAQTTAVVLSNDWRDADEDRRAGIKNLALLLGPRLFFFLLLLSLFLPSFFIALSVFLRLLPPLCLLVLLALPVHLSTILALRRGRRLPDVDARVAVGATIFHGALALGLALVV